jgi:hypothetical protein
MEIELDHVNVTVPPSGTDAVAAFYADAFGFVRIPKPPGGRHEGAWLQMTRTVQLHLSEHDAPPNPQAHFAIRVADLAGTRSTLEALDAPCESLADRGRGARFLARDPAGNGIEVCAATDGASVA